MDAQVVSAILSAGAVVLSAGISGIISWKVSEYKAKNECKSMHEQFLHEDQVRHDQWKHELETELRKAAAAKTDSYTSDLKNAMSKVSAYLANSCNMYNQIEASSAVRALYVSAPNDKKALLQRLAQSLEDDDEQMVRQLVSQI